MKRENRKDITFCKIEVPKELWKNFKETINKNHTINEILIELIKKRIKEHGEKKTI